MDTGERVFYEMFTRDDEKLAEVPRFEGQSESDLHRQFIGIR